MPRHYYLSALVALSLVNLPLPTTAWAEDLALEEVVVTARKREESLQEVPVAVSVFTTETMESLGIKNMRDFEGLVPGLNLGGGHVVGSTLKGEVGDIGGVVVQVSHPITGRRHGDRNARHVVRAYNLVVKRIDFQRANVWIGDIHTSRRLLGVKLDRKCACRIAPKLQPN